MTIGVTPQSPPPQPRGDGSTGGQCLAVDADVEAKCAALEEAASCLRKAGVDAQAKALGHVKISYAVYNLNSAIRMIIKYDLFECLVFELYGFSKIAFSKI